MPPIATDFLSSVSSCPTESTEDLTYGLIASWILAALTTIWACLERWGRRVDRCMDLWERTVAGVRHIIDTVRGLSRFGRTPDSPPRNEDIEMANRPSGGGARALELPNSFSAGIDLDDVTDDEVSFNPATVATIRRALGKTAATNIQGLILRWFFRSLVFSIVGFSITIISYML